LTSETNYWTPGNHVPDGIDLKNHFTQFLAIFKTTVQDQTACATKTRNGIETQDVTRRLTDGVVGKSRTAITGRHNMASWTLRASIKPNLGIILMSLNPAAE